MRELYKSFEEEASLYVATSTLRFISALLKLTFRCNCVSCLLLGSNYAFILFLDCVEYALYRSYKIFHDLHFRVTHFHFFLFKIFILDI